MAFPETVSKWVVFATPENIAAELDLSAVSPGWEWVATG
jgi:hypothetical protein